MTWGTNGEPDTDHPSSEELLVAAREFQAAHLAWELAATEEERAHRRTLLLLAYERLWPMLLSIVQPMARKWVRGHRIAHQLAGDWEQSLLSLATSYCLDIIEELPRLELKAGENIIGLFRMIAYRRMIDAERKRRRQEGGAATPHPHPVNC